MQVTELFRRGIIVPLDDESQWQLDSEDVNDRTQVEAISLNDDSLLDTLWSMSFFSSINKRAGSLIGDYETERLNVDQLVLMLKYLNTLCPTDEPFATFIRNLRTLGELAVTRRAPMYFVL